MAKFQELPSSPKSNVEEPVSNVTVTIHPWIVGADGSRGGIPHGGRIIKMQLGNCKSSDVEKAIREALLS